MIGGDPHYHKHNKIFKSLLSIHHQYSMNMAMSRSSTRYSHHITIHPSIISITSSSFYSINSCTNTSSNCWLCAHNPSPHSSIHQFTISMMLSNVRMTSGITHHPQIPFQSHQNVLQLLQQTAKAIYIILLFLNKVYVQK